MKKNMLATPPYPPASPVIAEEAATVTTAQTVAELNARPPSRIMYLLQ
jgi:hypothetical protein